MFFFPTNLNHNNSVSINKHLFWAKADTFSDTAEIIVVLPEPSAPLKHIKEPLPEATPGLPVSMTTATHLSSVIFCPTKHDDWRAAMF